MKLLSILCLCLSSCLAQPAYTEDYSFYAKAGVGVILDNPDKMTLNDNKGKQELYYSPNDIYDYSVELGIKRGYWNMGFGWADLLMQGESAKNHKPYKLEVFTDYNYYIQEDLRFVVGIGFNLHYQDYVQFDDGYKHYYAKGREQLVQRTTARLGLLKKKGSYEFGLMHHSQYGQGVPFNNEWEYHKTVFVINYVWER